ncbi:acyltransferase family protein [Actinoplanes sp. NPDC051513]|uniref:acyltransferase family protein n=1 Tax=Actinoplanes sp. NPDC051513 TaxID=3363908 RepID=UPI0037936DED
MAGTTQLGPHARKPELKALTGLRAIAAIAVVVSHVGVPKSLPEHVAKIAHWGYIGVPLFFMLSGVVLAYNYPELHPRNGRRTIKFYVARIARVMPLYWVMIAYCFGLYWSVNHKQYPWALVQNVLAVQTWSPDLLVAQSYYNGPGWSIGAELFFYALFPFLIPVMARIAKRWGPRGLVLVIAAVAVLTVALVAWFTITGRATLPAENPASGHRWLYRNPLCQLPVFICGMAIAFLLPHAREWGKVTHNVIQTAVPLYVLLLAAYRGEGSFWGVASYGAFFVIPFAVALLSLASGRGWLARFLSTRTMVSLGVASFALYLTHRWLVWQLSTFDPVAKGHGFEPYVGFVLTIAILLLIGEGAHRYVEEPARRGIIKISNKLARRFPARHAAAAHGAPTEVLELPALRQPASPVGS